MFEVSVQTSISSSHHLRGYQGKCEQIHGHNYRVEAAVTCERVDAIGLGIDFGILREILRRVCEPFDHTDLNGLPEFRALNPSAENLAQVLYGKLTVALQAQPVALQSVSVWETEGSRVTYRE
jgi:6-pyruvoyltetrahydropterin/6-carboxytetrahydropterin synthase